MCNYKKNSIKLEEAVMYAVGNRIGPISYNLFHHKGVAIAVFIDGLLMPHMLMQVIGIVLFGLSSMEHLFGYGLKTEEGFKFTHLGIIGKK